MKECWNINKPKVLSALKKSKMKEVDDILELMEDCATKDEKGELLYYFNQPNWTDWLQTGMNSHQNECKHKFISVSAVTAR